MKDSADAFEEATEALREKYANQNGGNFYHINN